MNDGLSTVSISTEELARLRGIEAAAAEVLRQWDGRKRSATPMLAAIAELRLALTEPSRALRGGSVRGSGRRGRRSGRQPC